MCNDQIMKLKEDN